MEIRYGFGKKAVLDFDSALEQVVRALQSEGFGVLTDIDVAATMKKKAMSQLNSGLYYCYTNQRDRCCDENRRISCFDCRA